jgi:phospholipid/cholesterol/gamma-HCH transport system substrate-binding protein
MTRSRRGTASSRRHLGARTYARPLAGLATIAVIGAIVAVALGLFQGDFTTTVPVTVMSPRAGLVMNPDAKVKLHGVQVGSVTAIDEQPSGDAAIHLALNPSQLHLIPANVLVNITAPTVFGAKFIDLVPPPDPAPGSVRAGQVLGAEHVTVEINTLFEQLTDVLAKIDPPKLNETLGAIAQTFNGRGEKFGQTITDFDRLLAKLDPSMANLEHELQISPAVFGAYGDAASSLLATADHGATISRTIAENQHDLDALLVSTIGLADTGNDVVGGNRQAITDVLHLLVPSTDVLNGYHEALYCGLAGLIPFAKLPPLPVPGIVISVDFTLGTERYRYPQDLPKVAAKGGPHCKELGLPNMPYEFKPPMLITDVGTNRARYGNQGILLNADGLKQFLFGPIDGPPRNTIQIGQPG